MNMPVTRKSPGSLRMRTCTGSFCTGSAGISVIVIAASAVTEATKTPSIATKEIAFIFFP